MAKFTWTAKDASGNQVVRVLSGSNAEEAKALLMAEGCTDVVLREDEFAHLASEQFTERSSILGEEITVTPEQRLKVMERRDRHPLRKILDTLVADAKLYGLLLLVIAYETYRGRYPIAIACAGGLLVWPVFRIWLSLPSYYYAQLNKAKDWHRWQEAMTLVEKSFKLRGSHPIKLPVIELARCRAQALAGLGHLDEALAAMKELENKPGVPSWMHKAHMAGLYDIVKQHDTAIEYNRAAIAENPSPVLYADLMNRLLRYKRDVAGAREAFAHVQNATMSEASKPFVTRCRGLLAYLEGDYPTAKKELQDAIAAVEAARKRPFRDGSLAVSRAYLCCVLAKQGDLAGAKNAFAQAKDYLVATNEKDLLAECNRAIGVV